MQNTLVIYKSTTNIICESLVVFPSKKLAGYSVSPLKDTSIVRQKKVWNTSHMYRNTTQDRSSKPNL